MNQFESNSVVGAGFINLNERGMNSLGFADASKPEAVLDGCPYMDSSSLRHLECQTESANHSQQ